jgi:tRNA pseudouridine38-40 synthase
LASFLSPHGGILERRFYKDTKAMRVFIKLAYDGSRFNGFQQQTHDTNTVMNLLIKALKKLNIHTTPAGAGRTDKGVHALGQVVHIDLPSYWKDLSLLKTTLQQHLLPFVHLQNIWEVPDTMHARFSATSRHYRYILSHDAFDPFRSAYVFFQPTKMSLLALNEALACFVGTHDFSLFKKQGSPTPTNVRTLTYAHAYMYRNCTIFSFRGSGFLRSQVRMMTQACLAYAQGRLSKEALCEQIANKHQHICSMVPPNGLYLWRIYY